MPPVTLYGLEALVDDSCLVEIIDEQVTPIDFSLTPDLIFITATTTQINRAKEISEVFRSKGIKTVIGGVHASSLPQDCQDHFDVVCVGEAEDYLEQLIADFINSKLSSQYLNRNPVDMNKVPFYNYEIGNGRYLPFHVINFSRGCSFSCDFCSIQSTLGGYRTRDVTSIVEQIRKKNSKYIWFPDSTLTANPKKAEELFRALKPLKIKWLSQISLNIAQNDHLIDLMADSGCWLVSIGFESIKKANLKKSRKSQNNIEVYQGLIKKLHARNIAIEGNFVFGFDEDDSQVFQDTADFIIENGIDLPELYMLTPYPDTPLYDRLYREGRIVDDNWEHYDNSHFIHLPVFQPKLMSREELLHGCRKAEMMVYSKFNTFRRFINSRVISLPTLFASYIYAKRMYYQNNLLPTAKIKCHW